jgi:hypothetical protein
MKKRSVAILSMLAAILVVAVFYAKERDTRSPAKRDISLQTPAKKLVVKKKTPAPAAVPSNTTPVVQLEYSEKEYQFLRKRYKSPNPQADGPLSGSRLRLLSKVTKNNIIYGRHLWPVVKEVIFGKRSALEDRLDTGVSANSSVIIGYPYNLRVSLLDLAIQAGQRGIIKVLLAHDASINPQSVDLSGVPPSAKPLQFAGPLALAAQYGEDDVVRTLLRQGANVNQGVALGGSNDSALSAAMYGGGVSTFYLLLTHGADINSVLGPGGTVPESLIEYYPGPRRKALRKLLIKYGAKMPATQ